MQSYKTLFRPIEFNIFFYLLHLHNFICTFLANNNETVYKEKLWRDTKLKTKDKKV